MLFTIQELSRLSGLAAAQLREYCRRGYLGSLPAAADPEAAVFIPADLLMARVLAKLHALAVPPPQIGQFLHSAGMERDWSAALADRPEMLRRIVPEEKAVATIQQVITGTGETHKSITVTAKMLPPLLIAGIRFRGNYAEAGTCLGIIARKMRPYLAGKPFCLHYQCEYREADADIEACYPVTTARQLEGLTIRELPGGICLSAVHPGPCDALGYAYEQIFARLKSQRLTYKLPLREVYLKGAGMALVANPRHYLTELQILINR